MWSFSQALQAMLNKLSMYISLYKQLCVGLSGGEYTGHVGVTCEQTKGGRGE